MTHRRNQAFAWLSHIPRHNKCPRSVQNPAFHSRTPVYQTNLIPFPNTWTQSGDCRCPARFQGFSFSLRSLSDFVSVKSRDTETRPTCAKVKLGRTLSGRKNRPNPLKNWSGRGDLNARPPAPKTDGVRFWNRLVFKYLWTKELVEAC